jgi:thiol-disulfide isomerase/thioredoxin/RNA polymerase subunit RPABC4/transcription elongation factor Spt4
MPSIICQRCHDINESNAITCQKCGARFCPSCHLVIDSPSASICQHCGKKDLGFRPGKFAATSYIPPSAQSTSFSQTYCSNCGSKIDPGMKKCPYCGRLGDLVTQTPQQGYGVMKPAHGEPVSSYSRSEPEAPAAQKVCMKCGTPIPPGSSLCPIHGKFGGGAKLTEGFTPQKDKRFEGEVYRRMMERSSAPTQQNRAPAGYTPPEQIYPQMGVSQPAPREDMMQSESAELRTCPNCGAQVPDRSKICPNCGNNRLPHQRSSPMLKAEEYYKSRVATAPQPVPSYSQPYSQPAEQYYGRPAVQPFEMAQPAPYPEMVARPHPEHKKVKHKAHKEAEHSERAHRQKKSPLPILLALLAVTGVIIISVVLVMDQLQTPQPVALQSTTATKPTVATPQNPVISAIQYSDVGQTSAVVAWKTDLRSNSLVQYCLNGGIQCETARDDTLVTDHSVKLSDLQPGTAYHITVISKLGSDLDSPEGTLDATDNLQTSAIVDTTPPKITGPTVTNLVSSSTAATATVEWQTDEPATSQVSYGTSATYGTVQPAQTDTTLVRDHSVTLNMLPLTATIHYKVVSRDAAGNEADSVDTTFLTPAASGTGIGQLAPDFTLTCTDGSNFTLSSLRGSKVILNFWSINCPPCRAEMPALQQMHERYPNLPIIAVHANILGSPEDYQIGGYLTDNAITLTVPIDKVGQAGSLYNITTIPRTFFLDSTGAIKKIQDGEFGGISEIETMYNSY